MSDLNAMSPASADADASGPDPRTLLLMELPTGAVWIELLPEVAPLHVERILALTREGAYDGVAFHRVIPGFMAQTGDVRFGQLGDGYDARRVGTGGSSYQNLPAEFSDLPFERGVVGMARARSPDSANSQFFITYGDAPWLDGQYTVFGRVLDGMTHIDALKAGTAASNGAVTGTPDAIISMTVAADVGVRDYRASDFADSVWAVGGFDIRGTRWEGTQLTVTRAVETDDAIALDAYFDWVGSNGSRGREIVVGAIADDGAISLRGVALEGAFGIGTAVYQGRASVDGATLSGTWSGGFSGAWTATRLSTADASLLPGDLALEYFARVTAYQEGELHAAHLASEAPDGPAVAQGYAVERVFEASAGSLRFYAVALQAEGRAPVLAVRGTADGLADWLMNADPRGVGYAEVDAVWAEIWAWLRAQDGPVSITGHSQGGAQAQIIAARAQDAAREEGIALRLGKIATFNPAGVDDDVAALFDPSLATRVIHHVAAGDVVSHAGARFLPGDVAYYDFRALDLFDTPFALLASAHTGHWSQPGMEAADTGEAGATFRALSSRGWRLDANVTDHAVLQAPGFSHLYSGERFDAEFFSLLHGVARLGPKMAALPAVGPLLAAATPALAVALSTRAGAEALRSAPGTAIELAADAFRAIVATGEALNALAAEIGAELAEGVLAATAWAARGVRYVVGWSEDMWRGFSALGREALAEIRDLSDAALDAVIGWSRAQWNGALAWGAEVWAGAKALSADVWTATAAWGTEAFRNVAAQGAAAAERAIAAAEAVGDAVEDAASASLRAAIRGAEDFWDWATGLADVVVVDPAPLAGGGLLASHAGSTPALLRRGDAPATLESLAGGSLYLTGAGDEVRLNDGDNLIFGLPATLDGVDVSGFGPTDRIVLPGVALRGETLLVSRGSAVFDLGDGTGFRLAGDYDAARFEVSGREDTTLRLAGAGAIALPDGGARYVTAGAAALRVAGGDGDDVIAGGSGDDVLAAGGGSNLLLGGGGDDVLIAGGAGDNLRGGDGADLFVIDGGAPGAGVRIDFIEDFAFGVDRVQIGGFEGIATFDDLTFRALAGQVALDLGGGRFAVFRGHDDVAAFSARDLDIAPHAQRLAFTGLASDVRLSSAADRFVALGGEGLEVRAGGASVIAGGAGADTLRGSDGSDALLGGGGDDLLDGGPGGDNLTGGAGADVFLFDVSGATAGRPTIDVIADFEPGVDRIALEGFGFGGPQDLTYRAVAGEVALELGAGWFVLLRGLPDRTRLDADDLLLA